MLIGQNRRLQIFWAWGFEPRCREVEPCTLGDNFGTSVVATFWGYVSERARIEEAQPNRPSKLSWFWKNWSQVLPTSPSRLEAIIDPDFNRRSTDLRTDQPSLGGWSRVNKSPYQESMGVVTVPHVGIIGQEVVTIITRWLQLWSGGYDPNLAIICHYNSKKVWWLRFPLITAP